MRRLFLLLVAGVALGRPDFSPAQENQGAVPLPPFIVEEASKGPPWRYAEVPGFEVLSRCGDSTTRDLVQAHWRLHQLLGLLVPERLQISFTQPKTIIFYDEALQSAASREVIASMLKNAAKEAPRVEMPALELGRFGMRGAMVPTPLTPRVSFLPNLRLWDKDAMTVFSIVRDGAFDSDRLELTRDYVNYLLTSRVPALPGWFVNGILTLYEEVGYDATSLTLQAINWPSVEQVAALKRDPKAIPVVAPLPLAEFFSGAPSTATPESEARRKIWAAQSALFVRWALDGRTPAQRETFWDFVAATTGNVSAESFQRCFGVDFAAADAQLATYLPAAVKKSFVLRPPHALKPPKIALRNASEAELARIKGDWERLEVGFVRVQAPDLAGKYLEQARRTLRHAYDLGSRDPRLLANLGLCECDAGDDGAARGYLEAAAQRGPMRARAAYELARLRFTAADAAAQGNGNRLSVEQVAEIFTPLFAVRLQPPPIPEVYELIARTWTRSAYAPTRGHLAILDEGVRLFPRRSLLVYQTAALYAARGFSAETAELVQLGLLVAADEAERSRFLQLQARLPVTPPAASK